MLTIAELYHEAVNDHHRSLELIIDYLVNEKEVLTMNDTKDKLEYYLQPKFQDKMNEYLLDYEKRRNA